MTQHKVISDDSLSAMDEISRVLGKDAVILKTEKINGKIHILGSNNIEDLASANAKKINKSKTSFSNLFSNHNLEQNTQNRKLESIIEKANTKHNSAEKINENSTNLKQKFVDIDTFSKFSKKIENLLENMIISNIDEYENYEVRSKAITLLKKGFSKSVIAQFQRRMPDEKGIDYLSLFYHYLSNLLVFPFKEKLLNSNIIFVNGASGSGKTTLCSKISSYILDNAFVAKDRHKLSIINFAPKSSNHSELLNYGRLLNVNVNSIASLEDIIKFIETNKHNRKLIIDVSQENNNSSGYLNYLNKMTLDEKCSNIVSIQASTNKKMLQSTMNFFKNSFPTIGLTKLDEAHIGPEELSILAELECQIGILSGSRSIIGSLAFAKKEVLAQYMKDVSI